MRYTKPRAGLAAGMTVILVGVLIEAGTPSAFARMLPISESVSPAFALLARSALAVHQRNYRGTQIVAVYGGPPTTVASAGTVNVSDAKAATYGGTAVTVFCDVVHRADVGTTLRLRETVQSPAQEYFQPDVGAPTAGGVLAGSPASTNDLGSGLSSAALGLLQAHYVAAMSGVETVAGRGADIVTLSRVDGTPAARFWLDQASTLPLRREVYDFRGRLLRASAFLELEISRVAGQHSGVRELPSASGVRVGGATLAAMRSAGWSVPEQVDVFDLFEARVAQTGTPTGTDPLLHLTYSDGLSSVSVFEQLGRLDSGGLAGWTQGQRGGHRVWIRAGVPERVSWSGHGRVYTVVSDLPGELVDEIVSTLPHDRTHRGFLHRLRRGVDRVGSWLNPFA